MFENQTNKERLKEITDSIEAGIKELFASDKYAQYLQVMSRFHRYSVNNQMLIYLQKPDATLVAGFNKWKDQFQRNVMKGEKGIKIIAPTPFKKKIEEQKVDPDTKLPLLDAEGNPIMEEKEVKIPMFKPVTVFDVSQTDGKPLPELASNLTGNVQNYEILMKALRRSSPVPIDIKPIRDSADGFFSLDSQRITVREGMSEVQTVSAAIHEIAHAKLHNTKEPVPENAKRYQEVEIFGVPALFSNGRVAAEDIPDGLFRYDLRGSDYDPGDPVTVEEYVMVNHAGSILTAKPLNIPEGGSLRLTEEEGLNCVGGEITAYQFRAEQAKDRNTEEVEAESISYAVCAYYGIATGENSFGYIATWSKDKELKELRSSLETINKTASQLIEDIDRNYAAIVKEREVELPEPEEPEKPLSEMNVLEMVEHFMAQGMTEEQANDLANSEWQARQTEQTIPDAEPEVEEALYILDEEQYLHIQRSEAGTWDCTFYDKKTNELKDGGLLDEPDLTIEEARDIILMELGFEPEKIEAIPQECLADTLEVIQNSVLAETEKAVENIREMEKAAESTVYLPDPTLTIDMMNRYGYMDTSMLPLSKDRAKELMERDVTVYALHMDNTEAMVFDESDLDNHDGLFGVAVDDWEEVRGTIPVRDIEQRFLTSPTDSMMIYQLREDAPVELHFRGLDRLKSPPDPANYDAIYTRELFPDNNTARILESFYYIFNEKHPGDFVGHSLSVSDIIALKLDGKVSYHYCDSIGFKELHDFKKPDNSLKSAEMSTEDDYGMIDGIINNGGREDSVAKSLRPSILAQLRDLKPETKTSTKTKKTEKER